MDIKDSSAHQILQRAHKNFKWPIKIWKLHVFESDMGHWPILRAHHHFGLGLTLLFLIDGYKKNTSDYCKIILHGDYVYNLNYYRCDWIA